MPHRILVLGPTSDRWEAIAPDVQADLARLGRAGIVDLVYRCTGAGPRAVRSAADVAEATPYVTAAIRAAEGFDAVIVDCTGDPGVVEARDTIAIPVVGPGASLRAAARGAQQPVVELSGEDLRLRTFRELTAIVGNAPTIAVGATGHSWTAERLALLAHQPTVLEPLELALEECIRILTGHAHDSTPDD